MSRAEEFIRSGISVDEEKALRAEVARLDRLLQEEIDRASILVSDYTSVAHANAALQLRLRAAESSARKAAEWQPTHEHYRGGLYREIARGRIEADLSPVVIYDNEKGETWVRPVDDFDQQDPFVRFAALPAG